MSDNNLRSPDERREPVSKDTTRHSDRKTRNTQQPDAVKLKGEVRHRYEAGDEDDTED